MSYHRAGLGMPPVTSTQAFVAARAPFAMQRPPGTIYSPIGMPMNYTHHIGFFREPMRKPVRALSGLGGILAAM